MSLLIPDTGLLFWMTLSFGIVFLILLKFGFPVITQAVEKRHEYIEKALADAGRAKEELLNLNLQAQNILQDAQSQRNMIIDQAREIKKKIVQEAKESAETEARQRIEHAHIEIEASKKRAFLTLKGEIADISVRIAEKVIGEELREGDRQIDMINRLLDKEWEGLEQV